MTRGKGGWRVAENLKKIMKKTVGAGIWSRFFWFEWVGIRGDGVGRGLGLGRGGGHPLPGPDEFNFSLPIVLNHYIKKRLIFCFQ